MEISVPIPNFESRKKNLIYHDINHIITGYDTSWKGESAISAWEIASGGWKNALAPWVLTLIAFTVEIICYPRNTIIAYNNGKKYLNSKSSSFSIDQIMNFTIIEARDKLRIISLKQKISSHH